MRAYFDTPLVRMLEAGFYEEYHQERQDIGAAVNASHWDYPISEMRAALQRLAATGTRDTGEGIVLEYTNRDTSGPVMPTIACHMQLLRAGPDPPPNRSCVSARTDSCEYQRYSAALACAGDDPINFAAQWDRPTTYNAFDFSGPLAFGELVQIDGCEHWWFEDRGPQCTLLVFIDDATSRLMHLQFVESESTLAYFHATRAYLEAWGKPVAFYSDKHGVFRVNHPGAPGGDGMTQFGRALHGLNIDIICANSSQAKGRVSTSPT
jgi:hypothetical protein